MLKTLFFAAALWASSAWSETGGYTWWCAIKAELEGNPRHFLLYGRDAWDGESIMRCHGPLVEYSQRVRVSFVSKQSGFGADSSSVLQFSITMWTGQRPENLNFTASAAGLVDGTLVHWNISSEGTELTASTWAGATAGARESLSLGTWSVRTVPVREP